MVIIRSKCGQQIKYKVFSNNDINGVETYLNGCMGEIEIMSV